MFLMEIHLCVDYYSVKNSKGFLVMIENGLIIASFLISSVVPVVLYRAVLREEKINLKFFLIYLLAHFLTELLLATNFYLGFLMLLIEPLVFFCYFYKKEKYDFLVSSFLALFIYQGMATSETFLSVIISSVVGDSFVDDHFGLFFTLVDLIAY